MMLKDYYKLLEVSPDASHQELKRSYRRLAQLHHPDKNAGNPAAEAHFRELNEAYLTLSNPSRREKYNYERWSLRRTGKKFFSPAFTAEAILAECITLKEYTETIDIFRMNEDALIQQLLLVLSEHNLSVIKNSKEWQVRRQMLNALLSAARPLSFRQILPLINRLGQVGGDDIESQKNLQQFLEQKRRSTNWDKYKMGLITLITILLCVLIYFLGKP